MNVNMPESQFAHVGPPPKPKRRRRKMRVIVIPDGNARGLEYAKQAFHGQSAGRQRQRTLPWLQDDRPEKPKREGEYVQTGDRALMGMTAQELRNLAAAGNPRATAELARRDANRAAKKAAS